MCPDSVPSQHYKPSKHTGIIPQSMVNLHRKVIQCTLQLLAHTTCLATAMQLPVLQQCGTCCMPFRLAGSHTGQPADHCSLVTCSPQQPGSTSTRWHERPAQHTPLSIPSPPCPHVHAVSNRTCQVNDNSTAQEKLVSYNPTHFSDQHPHGSAAGPATVHNEQGSTQCHHHHHQHCPPQRTFWAGRPQTATGFKTRRQSQASMLRRCLATSIGRSSRGPQPSSTGSSAPPEPSQVRCIHYKGEAAADKLAQR